MIVTVEYGGGEVTDPLENVTGVIRDKGDNLAVIFGDGTFSTFVNGEVEEVLDDQDTRKTHDTTTPS